MHHGPWSSPLRLGDGDGVLMRYGVVRLVFRDEFLDFYLFLCSFSRVSRHRARDADRSSETSIIVERELAIWAQRQRGGG